MSQQPSYIDPRGARFGAWITFVVFAVAIATPLHWLVGVQTAVFLTGAVLGLSKAPYGVLFRKFVRPRIGPPGELELEAPPRFAQAVGAVFGLAASIGFASGVELLGYVAAAFAIVAALLNAALGLCLGCEVYLLARRGQDIVRFTPVAGAR